MKQEDTKQRILDKALELFSAKGYDSVSVGEIAKAVGIKAPSLYNHFPSKQAEERSAIVPGVPQKKDCQSAVFFLGSIVYEVEATAIIMSNKYPLNDSSENIMLMAQNIPMISQAVLRSRS